ncbi:MAG: DNA polymerase I, partial [Proteobacteria bacterium]
SSALGLPVLELKGYEADDVIGTLTKRLADSGHEVVIVSGDKDMLQLIQPGVTMLDTLHDKRYTAAEVKEKFGVEPDKVVEVLALMGDSSDNIPGLDGVGPKTAAQLIEKFGDVETVISSIEQLKNDLSVRNRKKICEKLELSADKLRLSRKLVEIDTHAPVLVPFRLREGREEQGGEEIGRTGENKEAHDDPSSPEAEQQMNVGELSDQALTQSLKRRVPNLPVLRSLAERLEFSSLLSGLAANQSKEPESVDRLQSREDYTTIWADDFGAFIDELKRQPEFCVDLETTSLDTLQAQIVGVSICWDAKRAYYIPLGHKQAAKQQVELESFRKKLGLILEDEKIAKVGQNLKFDLEVLTRNGFTLRGIKFDTMIAAYLLAPDQDSYNMTELARRYLGGETEVIEFEEVLDGVSDFSEVPVERATVYACQDAHLTWLLKEKLKPLLQKEELQQVFYELEMPLVSILAAMELKGVKLDQATLAEMSGQFEQQLEALQKQLHDLAGGEFNINSPKQLSEILFNKLGLPTKGLKKTKTGISTDSGVLEKLSTLHPLPGLILDYRLLHKLKSTYIDALPAQISPVTDRLHTRFNQTGTGTGRLSSSDPNLQNIPIQTPEGRRIRSAFIAEEGNILISADYSQIELRLLAHLSADKNLSAAFKENVDIHSRTARELLKIPPLLEVTSEQRRIGKTINFGIIYGMGPYRLSRELHIPLSEANSYIQRYFEIFSGVREYFSQLEAQAVEQGFVRTILGRKRVLADLDIRERDEGFVRRAAINAPLQGSAADIIKMAMLNLDRRIRAENLPLDLLLQIHDELVFEAGSARSSELAEIIRKEMEEVVVLSVPLKVDVRIGHNWDEAH